MPFWDVAYMRTLLVLRAHWRRFGSKAMRNIRFHAYLMTFIGFGHPSGAVISTPASKEDVSVDNSSCRGLQSQDTCPVSNSTHIFVSLSFLPPVFLIWEMLSILLKSDVYQSNNHLVCCQGLERLPKRLQIDEVIIKIVRPCHGNRGWDIGSSKSKGGSNATRQERLPIDSLHPFQLTSPHCMMGSTSVPQYPQQWNWWRSFFRA